MKVQYLDDHAPRSDMMKGKPTGITKYSNYTVAKVLDEQYLLLNDDNKLCRYSKSRFVVVDDKKPLPVEQAFNALTHDMRMEIKRLRMLVDQNLKQS